MRYFNDKPHDEITDGTLHLAGPVSRRLRAAGLEVETVRTIYYNQEQTHVQMFLYVRRNVQHGSFWSLEVEQERTRELSYVKERAIAALVEWGCIPHVFPARIEDYIAVALVVPVDVEFPHEPAPKPDTAIYIAVTPQQRDKVGQLRLFDVGEGIQ